MNWLSDLFFNQTAFQAVAVISLISAVGLIFGRIKIGGVFLGTAFIFFVGIVAGHVGLAIDPEITNYIESFGLALFVYALGLQVGPGFFNALRSDGTRVVGLSAMVILLGTGMAVLCAEIFDISMVAMAGVLCGATTNTPALGAAQQTLIQLGIESNTSALSCALTYPLGVVGVILALIVIRKLFVRKSDLPVEQNTKRNAPFIAEFLVTNPALFEKSVMDIAHLNHTHKFVISRIWRDNRVTIPTSECLLHKGDHLLVITAQHDVDALTMIFGERAQKDWNATDVDWNKVDDSQLVSQRIVVTRSEINGKKLASLRLRNNYGINITRVYRSGVELLATPDLMLQFGDRLTVIGEKKSLKEVEKILGNAVQNLDEPNLVAIFIGLVLGITLGSIPFAIPGIDLPVKLGITGGPIIIGILIGAFGPRLHMITYTTHSANLMMRALGLSMYLACLGLDAGAEFFDTIVRPEGLVWLGLGFALTLIPVLIVALIALKIFKIDFGTVSGLLCASMANPMALNYANDTIEGDRPSISYATSYPISMFLRVLIIQLLLMWFY